jgi:hypothetical protein
MFGVRNLCDTCLHTKKECGAKDIVYYGDLVKGSTYAWVVMQCGMYCKGPNVSLEGQGGGN